MYTDWYGAFAISMARTYYRNRKTVFAMPLHLSPKCVLPVKKFSTFQNISRNPGSPSSTTGRPGKRNNIDININTNANI